MTTFKDIMVIIAILVGIIGIGFGFYLAWEPLGYIMSGMLIIAFAYYADSPFTDQKGGDNK